MKTASFACEYIKKQQIQRNWNQYWTTLIYLNLFSIYFGILCHKQLDEKTIIHNINWETWLLMNAICGFSILDELTHLPDLRMSNTSVWTSDWVTVILRNAALASGDNGEGPAEHWLTATNRLTHTQVKTWQGAMQSFCIDKDTYTYWSLRLYWKALAEMCLSLHDVTVLGRWRRHSITTKHTQFIFFIEIKH